MNRLFSAPLAALALTLAFSAGVQAAPLDPTQIQWSYNFAPGAPAVTADGNPAAGVTFTNEPTGFAVGSSDVVATNLRIFSAASSGTPDVLSSSGAYTLVLNLATVEDGFTYSGSLTFSGKLGGSFSKESANVTNAFGPNNTQVLSLGSYIFTVSLPFFTPPGPPDQTNAGSISAHVEVTALTPNQVPEPSTMLLSALGMSFLGGAAWRKRRQARQAA